MVKTINIMPQVKLGFTVKASTTVGNSTADLAKKNKGSVASITKVVHQDSACWWWFDDDDHEDDDGEVAKKMECSVASITKVLVHADYQDDDDVDNNDELWIDW